MKQRTPSFFYLLFTVLLVLIALVVLPARAEDVTAIATTSEPSVPLWLTLVLIIVSSAAAGGSVWQITNRAIDKTRNDPVALKNAEEAAKGVPQPVALALIDLAKTVKNVADLGIEILDGVPAQSKGVSGDTKQAPPVTQQIDPYYPPV